MNSKKKLKSKIEENPDKELYFFDESRFGTHSKLGHGWFKKGLRTEVKSKQGFKNFYVYSAVSPKTGDDFTIMAAKVNTDYMNMFLEGMSKHLGDRKAMIVMDCAGWHKSKNLVIPKNIEIIFLPPYSPELNPSERLWLYMKLKTIKNRIYETINELEKVICEFIKEFNNDLIKSICSMNNLQT